MIRPPRLIYILYFAIAITLLGVSSPATATVPAAQTFRAGAAASNVTPPLGLPIVGGWKSLDPAVSYDSVLRGTVCE